VLQKSDEAMLTVINVIRSAAIISFMQFFRLFSPRPPRLLGRGCRVDPVGVFRSCSPLLAHSPPLESADRLLGVASDPKAANPLRRRLREDKPIPENFSPSIFHHFHHISGPTSRGSQPGPRYGGQGGLDQPYINLSSREEG